MHGEPGFTRIDMLSVDRTVDRIVPRIRSLLSDQGIGVHGTEIGEFCTSQEMKGLWVTLIRLDDELKGIYDMPCDTAFYKKAVF